MAVETDGELTFVPSTWDPVRAAAGRLIAQFPQVGQCHIGHRHFSRAQRGLPPNSYTIDIYPENTDDYEDLRAVGIPEVWEGYRVFLSKGPYPGW